MADSIARRQFMGRGLGMGAGLVMLPGARRQFFERRTSRQGSVPILVTSHANSTGQEAARIGWEILSSGGSVLDAVESAANHIEDDPNDASVGYGGAPNEAGVVQLDASIMDGRTYSAAGVASLENIRHACSVARVVMERTDHVLMVGPGALEFARKMGFEAEDLLTERSREAWLRWREGLNPNDPWGPPSHLRTIPPGTVRESVGVGAGSPGHPSAGDLTGYYEELFGEDFHHGTTNVLGVDAEGNVAGITTTSGWAYKIPGRVGDSPIIGAGLYVDGEVGAAGAVGRGEDAIKSCATYYIVLRMKQGRSPQEACVDALEMILEKYRRVNPAFVPGEHYVAISREGEVGCAAMTSGARMTVVDRDGLRRVEGPRVAP
ncbi:N(4)-(beta-N-acetylglucosaminyl)-L-asparaginase [Gemmatimonadota bacterium]